MLLSLPFLWSGQLAGIFQIPLSIPLLKAAWWISTDGHVGFTALKAISKLREPAEAIGCAIAWTEKYPRVELSAYAGLLAAGAGLGDIARNMLVACGQFPVDRLGLTEMLEFTIAKQFEPFGAAGDCARRLEARRDLSASVSAMIHTELLWDAMLCGRLDEAGRRAEFMLSVGEAPPAHVALSALARHHGNETAALRHMDQARLAPAELCYYRFLSACGTGADAEAREMLDELGDYNVSLADYASAQVAAIRGEQ